MTTASDRCRGGAWDVVRELHPEFLDAYVKMAEVPERSGHLDPKVRAFVALAIDANVTHLDPDGMRSRLREARAAGASPEEILEVLECSATVSVHAMNVGVEVLLDVLQERGERTGAAPLTSYQDELKSNFATRRGYWNPTWDDILKVAPEMFEAYTAFSSVPWTTGHLSPLVKELIYIAFDTSVTHLYRVGLKLHIENALGYGASAEQVLEVMELATLIGMKSVLVGAPLLQAELSAEAGSPTS
ncbi:carboxymuconolactone decarboxylase family protein [Nocardioides sp.]|uniref:carboxymuconolactone decarboxylase family protein n=1 Tax=Nocardioides sp. TaxID=35761 RepID=UPI003D0A582A